MLLKVSFKVIFRPEEVVSPSTTSEEDINPLGVHLN
jgi:hypothetical protein